MQLLQMPHRFPQRSRATHWSAKSRKRWSTLWGWYCLMQESLALAPSEGLCDKLANVSFLFPECSRRWDHLDVPQQWAYLAPSTHTNPQAVCNTVSYFCFEDRGQGLGERVSEAWMVVGGTRESGGFDGRLCFDSAGCRILSDKGAQDGSLLLRCEGSCTDVWGSERVRGRASGPQHLDSFLDAYTIFFGCSWEHHSNISCLGGTVFWLHTVLRIILRADSHGSKRGWLFYLRMQVLFWLCGPKALPPTGTLECSPPQVKD